MVRYVLQEGEPNFQDFRTSHLLWGRAGAAEMGGHRNAWSSSGLHRLRGAPPGSQIEALAGSMRANDGSSPPWSR